MLSHHITVGHVSHPTKGWPRFSWTVLAFIGCVALGLFAYRFLLESRLQEQQRSGAKRLEFFTLTLDAVLTRHEVLPGVLGLERQLSAVLESPDDSTRNAANLFLQAAAAKAQVSAAYLIDDSGITLAASNWNQKTSFVGRDYGFRPYFLDALDGRLGRFYGVGVTSGEAGYFLATQIRTLRGASGVMAVKVTLEGFEEAMRQSGETVLLADQEGVVFLSSAPEWKYRALGPLSESVRERFRQTRQYGDAPLQPISDRKEALSPFGTVALTRGGTTRDYSVINHPIGPLGWQMILLMDPQEAHRAALTGALVVTLSGGLVLALAVQWDLRRRRRSERRAAEARLHAAHAELEGRIAQRTLALSDANAQLERKVAELKSAEAIVRETQDKAVQAGKLAVLGQLSAGMSHELNQPLTALLTLSGNGAKLLGKGRISEAQENLALISEVAARMGRTITQLKAFARKAPTSAQRVDVANAVSQAAMLVEPRREELRATIDQHDVPPELWVKADETRLAQVLVNLLRNGLDEVARQETRHVAVSAERAGPRVILRVRDSGPGIAPDVQPHLFEPFFTTKPAGEGLGLGLALSLGIVESMGGRLRAHSTPSGAEFSIELEAA
ncbi:sensor histidine kinase [Piscinibacter gummiphilus]|uniref:histidine kinase n=1 Tax=Piscinibacter gummiphilus TaxID=946333 RepID=A0ABZ0CM46_9BURK|nr:ATP-binding protein [Piscinibacter gummiphilus]WOB05903.1 ATP-binding protein [Piscinibacter gummiphilus]